MPKHNHPRKSFKIRQYIASKSVLHLTIVYIVVNIIIALCLAVALTAITRQPSEFINYTFYLYTELFGKEPRWSLPDRFLYQNIRAFLATISLLSPSLFLGMIIYKFFVLKRDNIVFRPFFDISRKEKEEYINVYFYISSSLRLINLSFTAFLRTYEKNNEDSGGEFYPMNTCELDIVSDDSFFPLPYNYVPSRFRVIINSEAQAEGQNGSRVIARDDGKLAIVTEKRKFTLDPAVGDFCELYVVARGELPDLQSHFYEIKCYRMPEDLAKDDLPPMITRFNRKRGSFTVENWEDFEKLSSNKKADVSEADKIELDVNPKT